MNVIDRFDKFWQLDEGTGCHLWTGSTTWGYGMFWADGRHNRAHRWIVENTDGVTIPDDMVVDHLCRNRGCVNRAHLEVVTQAVNARRRSDATHGPLERGCIHGHPASEMTLYVYDYATARRCRICGNDRAEAKRRALGMAVRGVEPARRRTREDNSCKRGHAWPEHLRITPTGLAFCAECKRETQRTRRAEAVLAVAEYRARHADTA